MEQNCTAFLVPTIFTVNALAVGFEQKQPARSANLISLEVIRWFDLSETKIGQSSLKTNLPLESQNTRDILLTTTVGK